MATTKTRRIYELYSGPNGPTPRTIEYNSMNKTVWHVAAVSVKQAVFLAAKNIWFDKPGGVGIVAHTHCASDAQWTRHDGTNAWGSPYKHYKTFTD